MKKGIFVVCLLVILTISLSGCIDVPDMADIDSFERVETENFILVDITVYSEDMIIQLIQDEFENGNKYVDSLSPDVVFGGRSVTMILFEKGE